MLGRLFRRDRHEARIASAVYGTIVAQARAPAFYTALRVPDTVGGRFEMLVLHTVLVVDRLSAGSDGEGAIAQEVFDLFCTDMDRSLRELGVGDMAVPKRMKEMGEAFYGRAAAYRPSLAAAAQADLAHAIGRNVLDDPSAPAGGPLADYALAAADRLRRTPVEKLAAGAPAFPDPAAFAAAAAV